MPKLDGLGLLQAIRGYPPTSKTAFIMLTGQGDKEHGPEGDAVRASTISSSSRSTRAALRRPRSKRVRRPTRHEASLPALAERSDHRHAGRVSGQRRKPDVVLTHAARLVRRRLHARSRRSGRRHEPLPAARATERTIRDVAALWRAPMELLVNGLLRDGARRERLQAKLFGGARHAGRAHRHRRDAMPTSPRSISAARTLPTPAAALRGERGRRIEFWPHTGRTRQLLVGTELRPGRPHHLPVWRSYSDRPELARSAGGHFGRARRARGSRVRSPEPNSGASLRRGSDRKAL